jgi:hypothetical protein
VITATRKRKPTKEIPSQREKKKDVAQPSEEKER